MKFFTQRLALLLGITLLVGGSLSSATASADGSVSAVQDVMKFELIRHELKISLSDGSASLDGQPFKTAAPVRSAGSLYVPLRALSGSGAASSALWDSSKHQARVVTNWGEFRFRAGSTLIYDAQDKAMPAETYTIPAPLLIKGAMYIPVRALPLLGISSGMSSGRLVWGWSDKKAEVLQPFWETGEAQAVFTVLYDKRLYTPSTLSALGAGAWNDEVRSQIVGKDISLNGALYNRLQVSVKLEPGINPLEISSPGMGAGGIRVRYNPVDPSLVPVSLTEAGTKALTVTSPSGGYLELKAGQSFTVAGRVADIPEYPVTQLKLVIQRYEPDNKDVMQDFKRVAAQNCPVKDGAFSGTITLKDPGSYRIYINAPTFSVLPSEGEATESWGAITVEVSE
ncbi:hypothetical protein KIH86_26695 [Paenibacillus sp. HN-1]|uniref:copper amine oxidase N-terminal domain-containing protein n=1 Tax=Paenibacillus TaxID=44249 RepID=UPI001CAA15C1|nr:MULTISPECIES: copper amine oxidase N-terminal domain-containing protein [Paenibacillus]MBY9080145.1 hypothetical protein [Paenibacillus sp. CGMCC 1.18879]MBY9087781.1 hypothetical protein [Paenibacillus sinensis]